MSEHTIPTAADVDAYLHQRRNWGRWGADDEVGALNLITAEKRVRAASLVRNGRVVSLSRPFPKVSAGNNLNPAQHFMRVTPRGDTGAGSVTDYYGISYHGTATTHLDALCHVWDNQGQWNGRKVGDTVDYNGVSWGGIQNWSTGITTRGVLLDVPRFRGEPYVTQEKPVHGWELAAVAEKQGVAIEPGDALCVYSGREAWDRDGHAIWGSGDARPGLHASCLAFIRDTDAALLVWDMMDHMPNEYGLPWTVHGAIFAYGIGLVDNALLEALADACVEEGRYDFMLTLAPILVIGGTGSPLNPIAHF